ncbi:hypothetical protein AB9T89_10465 [Flavobacterium oncorhynchi]|uniref:hypothetical protein n=1 Tax=Flavobacterium oncorhynchi TaxID=728056 RepID=UPI00351A07F7
MITWNNIKIVVVAVFLLVFVWLFKSWQYQQLENKRNAENIRQGQVVDSLKRAVYIYSDEQVKGYIESNESLKKIIKDLKIKENRIQDITESKYRYSNKEKKSIKIPIPSLVLKDSVFSDNVYNGYYLGGLVSSGNTGLRFSDGNDFKIIKEVSFSDSTECLTIKGNVKFELNSVIVEINDRQFRNKTTTIGYWERRQWKFLGIKTRFLGKVQSTVKVVDECGNSHIVNIEKKK